MKLLLDENIPIPLLSALRTAGWSVEHVAEVEPGIDDDAVLARARRTGAVLVTDDKDFGELVVQHQQGHHGVLLLRLAGVSHEARCRMVVGVLADSNVELEGAFTVLDARGRVRQR